MSYLDVPRIHISGQFFTDPSTVNNDPTHYDPDTTNPSPWQEPNGQHRFQLRNCTVKSILGSSGAITDDTLIGGQVDTNDQPDIARIVDIDVYQQGLSTIYGMQLKITSSDGQSILGTVDPASLNGLWLNSVLPTRSWEPGDYGQGSYGGDMDACGFFQTVVRFDLSSWPVNTSSKLLQELRAATVTINNQLLLSFRFVLDAYQNVPQDVNFRLGRITGALGPVNANEPLYNLGQRWLRPRAFNQTDPWYYPSFNDCPFQVDSQRQKLVLDLSNSICRQSAGGPPVDLGTLTAIVTTPSSPAKTTLGQVDYSGFSYDNNAGIAKMDLTSAQLKALAKGELSLVMSRTDLGLQGILTEAATDPLYAVEIRPMRMAGDPGTTATTQVYIFQNGIPVSNKKLAIAIESVHGNTPGATVPPSNPGNTPQADGAIKASITPSNQYGFATVTVTVQKDPGQRTPELDGQLYFIIVYDPDTPGPHKWTKVAPPQEHLISCLVWSQYPVNPNPKWVEIQAMMAPYMKLYPSMRAQLDLTDLHSFTIFSNNPPWGPVYNAPPYVSPDKRINIQAGAIPYYLTRDITDPRYMPITRDLSPNKLATILYFVQNLQKSGPSTSTPKT
ncbi:hypothetical protein [Spirosoma sp. KNUC1025]|uniref:hypothetical protein n=1 Tax=Spirosoma sp. KNUC1025 TaxID=2894082 RepID=UPI00386E8FA5|nr:hypothetical protein LN737_24420 [Spirosoma sp. KNUC1025]